LESDIDKLDIEDLGELNCQTFFIIQVVKPVLRGHLWDKDKVTL